MPDTAVRSVNNQQELLQQIDEITRAICQIFHDVPDEYLYSAANPDGWTVEKNMKHIASTNRLMSRWIKAPRFLLTLRGKPKTNLRIEDISATNRPNIRDYGSYEKQGAVPVGRKAELIQEIETSAETLKAAVRKRSEEELGKLSGLWGGMPLGIFAQFALKHGLHHASVVKARMHG
ncbi:MAG TPA: DinB family protein [Leptospiraceae bacterium]|jgi:hypothetical protein|nr:DinB family protein [Leptospirales bacterium]HMU83867.1 DinB family protein [Leptospiraceae bacterium]HMW60039.1 DinB family protein [Leptospiraceae bacterium]HMX55980.1 DinB family protein [Leptospiraceae bacterium]HMY45521.1 DinB family protein [Leptospiraceae bacterium]